MFLCTFSFELDFGVSSVQVFWYISNAREQEVQLVSGAVWIMHLHAGVPECALEIIPHLAELDFVG